VKEHPLATATKQQNGSSIATQQIDPLVLKGEGLGEIQKFGTVHDARIALDEKVRIDNSAALNGVLANTMILQSLYKKYHWLMRGITFYQLHLLLDKHSTEQLELIDALAERVQKLGASRSAITVTPPNSPTFRARPTACRAFQRCSKHYFRRTSSPSRAFVRPSTMRTRTGTRAPRTSS